MKNLDGQKGRQIDTHAEQYVHARAREYKFKCIYACTRAHL